MPRNLLLAYHEDRAVSFIEAFNLDRDRWSAASYCDNPPMILYDRIVIIRPHWNATQEEWQSFGIAIGRWWDHLKPNAVLRLI